MTTTSSHTTKTVTVYGWGMEFRTTGSADRWTTRNTVGEFATAGQAIRAEIANALLCNAIEGVENCTPDDYADDLDELARWADDDAANRYPTTQSELGVLAEDGGLLLVDADDENNAEVWWSAVRQQYPEFARAMMASDLGVLVTRRGWEQLATLPGFSDGPEIAQDALISHGDPRDHHDHDTIVELPTFVELS